MLKQSAVMALYAVCVAVGEYSLLESCNSVGQYKRRKLAACQHIIADGYLFGAKLIKHTLVNALIMSAEND